MTANPEARSARTAALPGVGAGGVARLAEARVLVLGAGGLGSPVIQYLAATGIGTLGIVDFDTVDRTNLQRQVIHSASDVGRLKTESAAEAVASTNDSVTVIQHPIRLEPGNALGLFADYDVIVDGTDNFATRYLANDAAAILQKPYVWGSVLQFDGEVTVFHETGDASAIDYRDLHPVPPPPDTVLSCADGGVLGSLCGTIGTWMASEVVKLITGVGVPLIGRMLHVDALSGDVDTIPLRRAPGREPVRELLGDYLAFCGTNDAGASEYGLTFESLPPRDTITLVDVREPAEHAGGHLPGDILIPLGDLLASPNVNAASPVVFYCETDARSRVACAASRAVGVDARFLVGGIRASRR